jgi:hypothetical protein
LRHKKSCEFLKEKEKQKKEVKENKTESNGSETLQIVSFLKEMVVEMMTQNSELMKEVIEKV